MRSTKKMPPLALHTRIRTSPSATAGNEPPADCFDFGGIAVSLASESRRWRRLARERYGAFAVAVPPAWRVTYRVTDPRAPSPAALFEARAAPPQGRRRGSRLELATAGFELALDRRRRTAELAGPLATYPVDRLIQALWYETAGRGLIFHGAALAHGGRGWLASGPSGSGKSTLAALLPERALCDELAAVDLGGGGPDTDLSGTRLPGTSAPCLASLPFWSSRPGSATLAGIYLLRHGERDRRRRLGAGEAFARLRRQVVWPVFDRQALARAFVTLFDLLDRVPVWELAFRPRPEVWDTIHREAA